MASEPFEVEAAAQGPCLEAIFVERHRYYNNLGAEVRTGSYLCEFRFGVTREYGCWHGQIPAEQLVGLTDWDVSRSIADAEFPPSEFIRRRCSCSACKGRVSEESALMRRRREQAAS